MTNLHDVWDKSGLREVHIEHAIRAFSSEAASGLLEQGQFHSVLISLLEGVGVQVPSEDVLVSVFQIFDRDGNGRVDLAELICGVAALCAGTEHEKIEAIFKLFDANGDGAIDFDEMYKFVVSIFRVMVTPQVLFQMNSEGANVDSVEDFASQVASECFASADLNNDGKISISEFVHWLNEGDNNCLLFPSWDVFSS